MIKIFKLISWGEGISYILLMLATINKNFLGGSHKYISMLGMPHGILFIVYIILAIMLKMELKWSNKTFVIVCLLSVLPFGVFFVGKYLKDETVQ